MTRHRRPATGLLVALALLSSACASNGRVASRPAPFPGVPAPVWGTTPDTGSAGLIRHVLDTAVSLRGARYQFGGASPDGGFDCSGFVRYVFGQFQVDVPRTVIEQFESSRKIAFARVSAGDLVFFTTTGPGATHVGIVLDPQAQTFVHAPGTGSVVRIERFDTPYWRSRLLGARRLALPAQPSS